MHTDKIKAKKLITYFERFLTIDDCYEKSTVKYAYPLRSDKIKFHLEGPHGVERVEDYIYIQNQKKVNKLLTQVRTTFKNYSLNPHKPYEPLKYFVRSNNIMSQLYNFFNNLINDEEYVQKVVYVGGKGSGKTINQNCWLHANNDLLEENNVIWVRCDAAKLYRLWISPDHEKYLHNQPNKDEAGNDLFYKNCVTIIEYFYIQFLYVFIKYLDSSPLFMRLYEDLKTKKILYNYRVSRKSLLTEKKLVTAGIDEIRDIINVVEKGKEDGYSHAYEMMKQAQKQTNIYYKEWDNWKNLSIEIEQFILRENYKIIRIIDGIDNIELFSEQAVLYYKKMIQLISDLLSTRVQGGVWYFMVMRQDTLSHVLNHAYISSESYDFQTTYRVMRHECVDMGAISRKRNEYIKKEIHSNIPDSVDATIEDREYQIYLDIIDRLYKIQENNDILMKMYNVNIRLYLHEKLSLSLLMYYRILQVAGSFDSNLFYSLYRLMSPRNKFLDGRFFLNSLGEKNSTFEQGRYMHNIFYFDDTSYSDCVNNHNNKWPGLCGLRIMQTIQLTNKSKRKEIVDHLMVNFNYSKKYIKQSLRKLLHYGLICSDINIDEPYEHLYYRITNKWKHVEQVIFSNYDVLYLLALDTPVPETYIGNDCFLSYSNKISELSQHTIPYPTNYITTSIITVAHFLRFLINVDQEERLLMKDTDYRDLYALPLLKKSRFYKIILRFIALYKSSKQEDRDVINAHFIKTGCGSIKDILSYN